MVEAWALCIPAENGVFNFEFEWISYTALKVNL